jgi:5-methylcytosine-specific restriction endonuclease McrA
LDMCKACRQRVKGQGWYQRWKVKHRRPARAFNCANCGALVHAAHGDKRRKFCSHKCIKAHANRNGGRLNRRARKRDARRSIVRPTDIYERDRFTCQICGRRMEMKAKVPHPLAPTVDHIVPYAANGLHEPANVQAAHFRCNSQRSDKGPAQLRMIG